MDLKETEARNGCADKGKQQFNQLTDWRVSSITIGVQLLWAVAVGMW
jgi:hypothetical protein